MKHIHLIGIGGTGLSAIARVLLERGYQVSGSDAVASPLFNAITAAGARTHLGHAADQIAGADLVIRSSAIPDDNPEVIAAQTKGIPVMKRADFLGELTRDKETLAVAGSHGKTTTTAMLVWILEQIGLHPSFIVGGLVNQLGCNARAGTGPHFVIEGDEYDLMFLGLSPRIAVITNIEYDHPDYFRSEADYQNAFKAFLKRVQPEGSTLICLDDPHARALYEEALSEGTRCLGYGTIPTADYQATSIVDKSSSPEFIFQYRDPNGSLQTLGRVTLSIPGVHNVLNATAALGVCHQLGLPLPEVIRAIETFTGAGRRFEILGQADGITVIDDYGHHPTEIGATLKAARTCYPNQRLWAVWQPHTYSRTQMLEDGFIKALNLADRVIVLKIYEAREHGLDYSAEKIAASLPNGKGIYVPDFQAATAILLEELIPGDAVLVFSAGDATEVSRDVFEGLKQRETKARIEAQPVNQPMEEIRAIYGPRLQEHASMVKYTSAQVGGPARGLIVINNLEELIEAAETLWRLGLSFLVLGSGANILVSDRGLDQIVLINRAQNIIVDPDAESPFVEAESGAFLGTLARKSASEGLSGLEWAAPIPGTIGGAIYGNAGAYGSDMASNLIMAKILHKNEGIQEWSVDKLAYQYRSSILKREKLPVVILSAAFKLARKSREEALNKINTYQAHRKVTQPPGASMGSIFKNPAGDYAGRLIEAAGLKGYRIGNAIISPIHANFIINLGSATAQDIWQLMKLAQSAVADKFGIHLEPEIELLGDFN